MREAVSDILVDRAREADGLARMVVYSLLIHVLLIAGIVAMPDSWRRANVDRAEQAMTIMLGGAPGPDQGMTAMANRPVQAVAPPDTKPVTQPAPAAKPPEMVVPETIAKANPKTPRIDKPQDKASSRKPTTGPEVKSGAAKVETGGAQVPFGGLATSSGGGDGATVVGINNFCCPWYLGTMKQLIQRNWDRNQGAAGETEVRFTIQRSGLLTDIKLEKSSGFVVLDQAAQRAVVRTRALPALPKEVPDSSITIILVFRYQR